MGNHIENYSTELNIYKNLFLAYKYIVYYHLLIKLTFVDIFWEQ